MTVRSSKQTKIIGILLAGGMSRRFGKPKAFQKLKGRPLYDYAYEALESVCDEVIIVTRPQFTDRFPNTYETVVDVPEYDGCGPLAGIYTAMKTKKGDHYIVLPCDMPLINGDIIQNLFRNHRFSVTVVDVEGKLQPLVSVWQATCKAAIREALEDGDYAMTSALDKLSGQTLSSRDLTNEPERFMNINSTQNWEEMTTWLES